jgi:hypothetical protein
MNAVVLFGYRYYWETHLEFFKRGLLEDGLR